MLKKIIIKLIFISLLFPGIDDIYETRFEKFWKKTFHKMNFREPVKLIPYNLKIGYYSYGGTDYWDNIITGDNILEVSPYNLSDQDFPNINNIKYRRGTSIELDLLKYNFFHKYQNFADILLGVGYKYKRSTHASNVNTASISLQPNFQGWNINSTFLKQWSPKFSTYFYYFYGPTRAKFYVSSLGNASGTGNTSGFGIGFNIIKSNSIKKNNFNYGFLIAFEECKIDDINEPVGLNKIIGFHSQEIVISYSIGIGYGGQQSDGDMAYMDILNGEYITALEKLQTFQYDNPYQSKNIDIKKMMEICREEIPNQLYQKAMSNYYDGDLEKAMELLFRANYSADEKLNFEIESKKFIIADEMVQNAEKLIKYFSIDQKIEFYEKIKTLTNKLDKKINNKISVLLINQGSVFVEGGNYKDGYQRYLSSLKYDESNQYIIDIKINNMITMILNDVYKFLQINEHVIAYEHLSFIQDISRYNENSKALMDIVFQKLEDEKLIAIRDRVKNILKEDKKFVIKMDPKDIYLGDTYDEILNILGFPYKMLDKKKIDNNYEMLIFIIENIQYRLFFKNKILIDVERES